MRQLRFIINLKKPYLFPVSLCLLLTSMTSLADISKAPAIHLPAIEGEVDLVQLQDKLVYLDFWASWCDPCRDSFPWMAEMKEKYGSDGLEVVAVNLDKERTLADKFLDTMKVNFVVAFDASGESAEKYKLRGMPGSYLIGRDGNIQASNLGFNDRDKAKLEAALKVLLQQQ
ncbi:MAG: TlpA family protein disulfide reductase [Gammaproteobacteria bacterium]|nr:TlpA family protein disulfide reductase [Gammaproteobacteria bacterium]